MAKPGERKVNRTCTYVRADGTLRPAIITALGAGTAVDVRVGHHGEVYTNVPEQTTRTDTGVWRPGSENRYP